MAEVASYHVDGPKGAPALVLVGSLGTTADVWSKQVPVFSQWFRVISVEHPGHGGAEVPDGPGTVAALGLRLLGILDTLGIERAHFAGLSLGGLVCMWLGAEHPKRVARLAVCCTPARFANADSYLERAAGVRSAGTAPLVAGALGRWFTQAFLSQHPSVAEEYSAMLAGIDPAGYSYCCEAVGRTDLSGHLGRIEAPTLVVAGSVDPVVPPELAAGTMAAIPGAGLAVIAGGAHLVNLEQPGAFNDALLSHFAGRPNERGERERRAVLGGSHVDRELAGGAFFGDAFQEMLAKWPWGEVWARPGLDRQTRRLLAIAMLASLGRSEELEVHLRAALIGRPGEEGTKKELLKEVLLQVAIYAGVPAANSAFRIARRVLAENHD